MSLYESDQPFDDDTYWINQREADDYRDEAEGLLEEEYPDGLEEGLGGDSEHDYIHESECERYDREQEEAGYE